VQIFNSTENIRTGIKRGGTPDISHTLMFYWFEYVMYLGTISKFSENIKRPGYFVGFADNVGDALTFKILENDLVTVLHRSVVRSAAIEEYHLSQMYKNHLNY
jgi:hypothetical protein